MNDKTELQARVTELEQIVLGHLAYADELLERLSDRGINMIEKLSKRVMKATDEMMATPYPGAAMDKIEKGQKHLAFIPARTATDIHSKLTICVQTGIVEGSAAELAMLDEYMAAWLSGRIEFIRANNATVMAMFWREMGSYTGNNADTNWNNLFKSVKTDIDGFLTVTIH